METTRRAYFIRFAIVAAVLLVAACIFAGVTAKSAYAFTYSKTIYVSGITTGTKNKASQNTSAIQIALDKATQSSVSDNSRLRVRIYSSGTVYINDTLLIYSNTTLELGDNTVIRMTNGTTEYMLRNAHEHSNGYTYFGSTSACVASSCGGYKQSRNIIVRGGAWKQYAANTANETRIFSLRHCKNITLENIEMYYANEHFINMSATYNATITDVNFHKSYKWTNKSNDDYAAIEALHLDYSEDEGEPYLYPQDDTPCKCITVSNCTFDNVHAGVGTHMHNNHVSTNSYGSNIVVQNCTFKEMEGRAINFTNFNYSKALNNTINFAQVAINIVGGSNITVSGNTTNYCLSSFIKCYNASNVTFTKNVGNYGCMNDEKNDSGFYFENSKATLTSNTVNTVPGIGIYMRLGGTYTVKGNTVHGCGTFGIRTIGTSSKYCKATISGNSLYGNTKYDVYLASYTKYSTVSENTFSKGIYKVGTDLVSNTISQNFYRSSSVSKTSVSSLTKYSSGIKVAWKKNSTAKGYIVYRSINGGLYKRIKTITSASTVSYFDSAAKTKDTRYRYKVVAYKTVGGVTYVAVSAGSSKALTR